MGRERQRNALAPGSLVTTKGNKLRANTALGVGLGAEEDPWKES